MPVAFVIGGARRLGRSITQRLASQGYDVGITYNSSGDLAASLQSEVELHGCRLTHVQCDVRSEQQLKHAWTQLTTDLGLPAVVIVAAGVFPDPQHPGTISSEQFIDTMRINTLPLILLTGIYATVCDEAKTTGRVISLGSLGATEIWKNRLLYNASKAAARTSALSLARSLAPTLSVNIVAPGAISQPHDMTDVDKRLIPAERIPMQRHGSDQDVCDAVMFFTSAPHYITGQTIYVDGGYGLTR